MHARVCWGNGVRVRLGCCEDVVGSGCWEVWYSGVRDVLYKSPLHIRASLSGTLVEED